MAIHEGLKGQNLAIYKDDFAINGIFLNQFMTDLEKLAEILKDE